MSPGIQFGSGPDARLLCLKNEGAPHVLLDHVGPDERPARGRHAVRDGARHDRHAGDHRVQFNEPLDPVSVVPYIPSTQLSLNVQLWHVGDTDANAIVPQQIQTNKPLVVQDLDQTEVILVAVGPQPQGTYLVNIQGCKDLPGNPARHVGHARSGPGRLRRDQHGAHRHRAAGLSASTSARSSSRARAAP